MVKRINNDDKVFLGEYSSEQWATLENVMFPESYIKEAEEQIDDLITLLNLEQGKKLLDIPCGIGRHSFHLAKRGIVVTGVDICINYLNKLTIKAKNINVHYEVVQEDMRSFKRPNYFDVVICLWESLGFFSSAEDDKVILRNLYNSLNTGGKLLIEVTPLEVWVYNICTNSSSAGTEFANVHYEQIRQEKNLSLLKRNIFFDDDFKRVQIHLFEKNNITGEEYETLATLRTRSVNQWVEVMENLGYKNISLHTGFSYNQYTTEDIIKGRPVKILAHK